MNRVPYGREFHVKGSAASRRRPYVNLSSVFLNDSVTHGQAETRATTSRFGREKGVEYLVDVIAGNSVACVRDLDFNAAIVSSGAHFQDSAGGHGVPRIQKEIQKYLLQLVGRAAHWGNPFGELLHHLNL
jgi:hypothetical protein